MKTINIIDWAVRIIASLLLVQTLYYKFMGADESIYIFSTLGMEPWGRIGTGMAELIAAFLLLMPSTKFYGALLSGAIITGAIAAHLLFLGIEVQGDGGLLFGYAITILICNIITLFISKQIILKFIQVKKSL